MEKMKILIGEEMELAEKIIEKSVQELRARELNVTSSILKGNPKHVLVEEAEKWGADCIFVGSTGLSRLERFLLGSVSAAVVARAHCSVEVIRAKRRDL